MIGILMLVILIMIIMIGLPVLVFVLFDTASRAKKESRQGIYWFLLWVIGMVSILLVVVFYAFLTRWL